MRGGSGHGVSDEGCRFTQKKNSETPSPFLKFCGWRTVVLKVDGYVNSKGSGRSMILLHTARGFGRRIQNLPQVPSSAIWTGVTFRDAILSMIQKGEKNPSRIIDLRRADGHLEWTAFKLRVLSAWTVVSRHVYHSVTSPSPRSLH